MGNESDDQQRSVLPPPDPAFRGEINVAFTDSKADFPEQALKQVTVEAK